MITETHSPGKLESLRLAEASFREMVQLVERVIGSGEIRIDEAERTLFDKGLTIGKQLLAALIAGVGDGDHGETVEHDGQTLQRSEEKKTKKYRSIFGVLDVSRYVYAPGAKKKVAWRPVDERLGLPEGEQSYVLEDWLQRLCVKESFAEGVGSLRDLLGVKTSVRAAEVMSRNMAEYAEGFTDTTTVDPDTEEAILVLQADGKGVPMRRSLEARLQEHQAQHAPAETEGEAEDAAAEDPPTPRKRLRRGEKRTRKQMAYVGTVFSIAPFVRTADEVLDDLRRRQRQSERPQPQNKQVFATMTRFAEGEVIPGQERCFSRLAWSAVMRAGPDKTIVCLMDGQKSLWNLKEGWFPRAVGVLDIFHVLERLWGVAQAFHGEATPAAEAQVDAHLRLLLEGRVSCVIGLYKRMLPRYTMSAERAKSVRETITFLENNKQYMKYDEYLAAGYPIGTGVVEGACRHFVKDRMELAGMRWEIEGASAMLSLRALHLNDQWEDFVEHRIQAEQDSLYGQAA